MTFNLNTLSIYRTELMGFAALMILLCHATSFASNIPFESEVKHLFVIGNLGVEIFFLLSGMGLAFSLSHHKGDIAAWYKKRYVRIMIPYLLIAVPRYGIEWLASDGSLVDFIINVSTLNYWMYHHGAWFVAALIPLYLVTPLLFKIMKSQYGNYVFTVLVLGCALLARFDAHDSCNVIDNIIAAAKRLPCFFIGIWIYNAVVSNKQVAIWKIVVCVLLAMVLCKILVNEYLWPLTFMIIPIACILMKVSSIERIFTFYGKISLESYIANISLLGIFNSCVNNCYQWGVSYLIIVIVGTIIAYSVSKLKEYLV